MASMPYGRPHVLGRDCSSDPGVMHREPVSCSIAIVAAALRPIQLLWHCQLDGGFHFVPTSK